MDIIKASGEKEKFNKEKLHNSLKRAGAEPGLAQKISQEVARSVHPGADTGKIFNQTFRSLQKASPILAAKYNLKRAIMELGPTGFPFEKYIAEILKEYGYNVRVGQQVQGHCVSHEVDIIARKENKHFMIECKYHNSRGNRSDVKVAMYTYARFLDVKKFFHQAWLITNTKCTSQAVRYARCVGLKIISWRYPKNESLEYLIEKKGLYPITILPSLNRYARERLAESKIMLARDLLKYSVNDLARLTGLRSNAVKNLQKEAKELCGC
ncbi:MAG: restriction endonuclease [Candidatus Nealsonbacteria bacterium]|nr:restriction endonuclease [Candidatus Nealsonbacteria bacterium]